MKADLPPLWRDAWESLRSRPGRSLLALGAVALGIAALALLVAVLDGLNARARALVSELGADVVAIRDASDRLGPAHLAALEAGLPGAAISRLRMEQAPTLGSAEALTVGATDAHLAAVRGWRMLEGRFLDAHDVARAERHAVLSAELAADWGWGVGDTVQAGRTVFRIVGVLEPGGLGAAGERGLLVPYTVAPTWSVGRSNPQEAFGAVYLRAPPGLDADEAAAAAGRILAAPDLRLEGVEIVSPRILLRGVRRMQRGVALAMGSVAALALVLGGTTLMSLMTASVVERTPEIGLRRALGGTPRDIAALFVAEACAVTAAAGVLGVAAGALAAPLLQRALAVPLQFGVPACAVPFAFACAAGMVFAWGPALRAARIAPSEALRAG